MYPGLSPAKVEGRKAMLCMLNHKDIWLSLHYREIIHTTQNLNIINTNTCKL